MLPAGTWPMILQRQHHGESRLLVFIPYRCSLGLPKSDKFSPHGRGANSRGKMAAIDANYDGPTRGGPRSWPGVRDQNSSAAPK